MYDPKQEPTTFRVRDPEHVEQKLWGYFRKGGAVPLCPLSAMDKVQAAIDSFAREYGFSGEAEDRLGRFLSEMQQIKRREGERRFGNETFGNYARDKGKIC